MLIITLKLSSKILNTVEVQKSKLINVDAKRELSLKIKSLK